MKRKGEHNFKVEIMCFSSGVTGNQILIVITINQKKYIYMVDCGYDFERSLEEQGLISKNPDKVLLTHAHTDHIAMLLELCKTFRGDILTSNDTRNLMGPSLDDTVTIQKGVAKSSGIKQRFSEQNISQVIDQVKTIKFLKRYEIDENIFVTLIPNSHLPGSACIFLEIVYPNDEHGYKIPPLNFFFTGDLKLKGNPFLEDTVIPEEILEKPVYIITESTYGAEEKRREKVCRQNIKEAISKGKKVILTALSLGRGQELMLEIKKMQENGDIPEDIPVYIDGKLMFKYINKYNKQLDILVKDFEPHNASYVNGEKRAQVVSSSKPCIIIASSGNATFGPSNEYVSKHIENENALIHFTSYQPEGTLGRKLLNLQKGDTININGEDRTIKADIKFTSEYSSHAEKYEILDFISNFKDIRGILVTHGEEDARESLIKDLKKLMPKTKIVNFNIDKFIRIDRLACGNMKEMNSKLSDGRSKKEKKAKDRKKVKTSEKRKGDRKIASRLKYSYSKLY